MESIVPNGVCRVYLPVLPNTAHKGPCLTFSLFYAVFTNTLAAICNECMDSVDLLLGFSKTVSSSVRLRCTEACFGAVNANSKEKFSQMMLVNS